MGDWIDFDRWPDCVSMERPAIVFEIENSERQVLLTECIVPLPTPSGWTSPPVRFRAVEAPEPRHSSPIPKPQQRR